ncbi:30S ribosomal protein S6-like isoform X2 [Tripterygium wilfordii]|uniref:30S ribosomal protein S6-like isoform X2 n=1 Tax=Tripterygium wilfordii TaxID=458696 RepID=UPI0018F8115A|nr:30S ribosomal protein S6-like isoform X2 [Tripterygium wilfordii]
MITSAGHSLTISSSLKFGPGCSFSSQKLSLGLRKAVIVGAKKDNKNKKEDNHSFVPKPEEATGFFSEAVLLKEKKVQEDGRILPEFADAEEEELFELLNLQLQSESDVMQTRHYEVVYIIHEKHEEEVGSVNEKVQDFLREKKAKIWRLNDWGLRRLAYKIQKAKNGHYILMNFELEGKWINDFKTMLDKDERVIRHLVMKADEAITEDCPPPPEFHTLCAGTDDDDEEDDIDEDDGDVDYDDEEYGEELADGSFDDDREDGVILNRFENSEVRENELSTIKRRHEKVGR